MNESELSPPFRLSTGGLFYRLMPRLRLVEENQYHPWRRIALFSGIEKTKSGRGTALITTADPSTLADFSVVYETISSMRLIPLNRQKVIRLMLILIAPFLPLILTQFSVKEALNRLAQMLV